MILDATIIENGHYFRCKEGYVWRVLGQDGGYFIVQSDGAWGTVEKHYTDFVEIIRKAPEVEE